MKDQQKLGIANVTYHPGGENLADFPTKHHPPSHYKAVRKYYCHDESTPQYLTHALQPSQLRGCVKPLQNLGGQTRQTDWVPMTTLDRN